MKKLLSILVISLALIPSSNSVAADSIFAHCPDDVNSPEWRRCVLNSRDIPYLSDTCNHMESEFGWTMCIFETVHVHNLMTDMDSWLNYAETEQYENINKKLDEDIDVFDTYIVCLLRCELSESSYSDGYYHCAEKYCLP